MKNWAISVADRLKTIMRETGEPFNDLCRQYVQERFLAKLNDSEFRENFVLKGGILFHVWAGQKFRPTKDLDFMYFGDFEHADLLEKIKSVCERSIPEEGILYLLDSLAYQEIKEDHEYDGVRVTFKAMIGKILVPMQLDICTGDKITPCIREMAFPAILGNDSPMLNTYPIETVLAEKVHAMINLDITNSRLKDYFDVYMILTNLSDVPDLVFVKKAIVTTFLHRGLTLPAAPVKIWTDYFSNDQSKIAQWHGFLKRSKYKKEDLTLKEVCLKIGKYFNPIFEEVDLPKEV